jgi:hypothetical protein
MSLKDNITKIIIALIIGYFSWLSYTVRSMSTSVVLLESKFFQVDENKNELNKRSDFITNTKLLNQNHSLRIQILENYHK